jgi:hypothetical protein
MQIYFACSLTGGREFEGFYGQIVQHLLAKGVRVPTAHLADPGVMALERVVDPVEVYERDVAWIRESDALIAEVSTPSHGVGYEIGYALSLGKPVLCCHKKGVTISKMILGNRAPKLRVRAYGDEVELRSVVDDFLHWINSQGP